MILSYKPTISASFFFVKIFYFNYTSRNYFIFFILVNLNFEVKLGEGDICYVAGWGRIGETLGTARILQETQVPIVNNTVCDAAYVRNHVTEEAMLCAGYAEGGIDACQENETKI